jgi:hypothetical protein
MTQPYRQYYDVLGIRPGATWNDLKKTYRRQIRSWHPDQFPYHTEKKQLAEEQTKLINQAYRELGRYYRQYNALPLSMSPPTSRSYEATPASRYPRYRHSGPASESATPTGHDTPPSPAPGRRVSVSRYAVLLLGIVSGYLILQPVFDPESNPVTLPDTTLANSTPTSTMALPTDKGGPARLFTIGTSLGEVYSIQGVPTKTEKDIWYYGDSMIFFTQGHVADWKSTTEHPLHAQTGLSTEAGVAPPLVFGKGSTKPEVRLIQGEPLRSSERVWHYGSSLVFFENDRVVSWQESPFNLLKVRK